MKPLYMGMILIFCFTILNLGGMTIDNLDIVTDRYKRALDAGAYAAAKFSPYDTSSYLRNTGSGFGTGTEHSNNLIISQDESLKWFYRVFFRNIGAENNEVLQEELKKYMPMKAIVGYDRLLIADHEDNWIVDKQYDIEYNGTMYRFTLSDQVMALPSGAWKKDTEYGIPESKRKSLVNMFIRQEIDNVINNRLYFDSNKYYDVNIALNDTDPKLSGINGVNFIVFAEGMPIPNYNLTSKKRFLYTFGIGGSEITRE